MNLQMTNRISGMGLATVMSLSAAGCGAGDNNVTPEAQIMECLFESARESVESNKISGARIELVETSEKCRTTSEAYRFYQQCEVLMSLHPSATCVDQYNPNTNRIPSTLKDAKSSRESLEPNVRRDCGYDPIPTTAILAEIEKCTT